MVDYAWFPHSRSNPGDVVIANAQQRCISAKYVYLPAGICCPRLAAKEQLRLATLGALAGAAGGVQQRLFGLVSQLGGGTARGAGPPRRGIAFTKAGNCFGMIADPADLAPDRGANPRTGPMSAVTTNESASICKRFSTILPSKNA